MFDSNNPYAPPPCSGKGQYDWTLAKRMFLAFAALAAFYLLCDAILLWQSFGDAQIDANNSIFDQVKAFLFDWRKL